MRMLAYMCALQYFVRPTDIETLDLVGFILAGVMCAIQDLTDILDKKEDA